MEHTHDHGYGGHGGHAKHGHDPDGPTPEEMEEAQHFQDVISSFSFYGQYATHVLDSYWSQLSSLTAEQKAILPHLPEKIIQGFIDQVLDFEQIFPNRQPASLIHEQRKRPSESNMDKVKTTLKQFMRDWSTEGQQERDESYAPLLAALLQLLPPGEVGSERKRVCVPGAGLGRLAFDICRAGYECEGNEFSFFMLIASNFVLNRTQVAGAFPLHPWVLTTQNVYHSADVLQEIRIPDVVPSRYLTADSGFSMCAGDFVECYGDPANESSWDAVVTSFFLDTARNVFDYVRVIRHMLRPGGLWLNNGPLLWHWTGMSGEQSIDLSWDEVRLVILSAGFEITSFVNEQGGDGALWKRERPSGTPERRWSPFVEWPVVEEQEDIFLEERKDAQYTSPRHSMMTSTYHCVQFNAILHK